MYKDKWSERKMSKIFVYQCDVKMFFEIYFTELGDVMTNVVPVLFKYYYKYCYSDRRRLSALMKGGGLAH